MRMTTRVQLIFGVLVVFFLLWILGLALGWGGWLWVFFVVWLLALATSVVAFIGSRHR